MQQFRREPNLVDVAIIALTALVFTGDRDRCLVLTANDNLSKSVKLNQLATNINF